jgi:hypothetical protein
MRSCARYIIAPAHRLRSYVIYVQLQVHLSPTAETSFSPSVVKANEVSVLPSSTQRGMTLLLFQPSICYVLVIVL